MVARQALLAAFSILSRSFAVAGPPSTTADYVEWDDSTYTLASSSPNPGVFQAWLPQSNGYISLAQGSLGPFLEGSRSNESTGWSLSPQQTFATVTGFWDAEPDGESVIAGIPHFTDLLVGACGTTLNGTTDVSEIRDFKSTFSFSTGIATWDYVWSPPTCSEDVALTVSYEAFLSLDERQIGAVKLSVSSNSNVEILITDVLDGHSANRTSDAEPRFFPPRRAILTSLKPKGADHITAIVFSTVRGDDLPQFQKGLSADPDTKSISQTYSLTLDPAVNAGTSTVFKYVGVMSTEHFPDANVLIPKAVNQAAVAGWDAFRSAHIAQVAGLMHSDFLTDFRDPVTGDLPEDSNILSLHITAIASTYYFSTSLLPYDEPDAPLSDSLGNMLDSGCAFWTFLLQSFLPYTRVPWYQFSEPQDDGPDANVGSSSLKETEPRFFFGGANPGFPFMTGHGGLLEAMTAGFLGARTTDVNLVLNPSLPPPLEHFKAPLQFYNGAAVECRVNRTHTTVTRRDATEFEGLGPDHYGDGAMPIAIGRSADDPDGYTIQLKPGETAVIANRQRSDEVSTPGNILHCKKSSSPDAHVPGQFPLAATDGYTGTSWQPKSDSAASLVVDLTGSAFESAREVDYVLLDFSTRPPKNIRILLSNESSFEDPAGGEPNPPAQWVPVAISEPWAPDSPVVQDAGNTTFIELPRGVWSGRYVRLDVEGCWAEDGAGATVAEFALVVRSAAASEVEDEVARTGDSKGIGHDEL